MPKAGRACTICTHESQSQINKDLMQGDSLRTVAERFGVTHMAAGRHLRNCLKQSRRREQEEKSRPVGLGTSEPAAGRFALNVIDGLDPAVLVSATARLVDEALDLLEHAKTKGDHRTALSALREARDGLQLLMRASGQLTGDGTTVYVDQRRQSAALFSKLSEADLRALIAKDTTTDAKALEGDFKLVE